MTQLSLKEADVQHVARILKATNWHRGRACEILGISRPRLRRIMTEADLKAPPHAAADDDGA
ncbi:MAG: helix-turn-helix domain-containing protein [Parvularculaceae bacterium]